jgi:hypothetical protein
LQSKYSHGITWSEQLADKREPIATHINWAIRNCNENPQQLKEYLENIVEHYSNNHTKCHPNSLYTFFPLCEVGAFGFLDFQIDVYFLSTFSFQ